MKCVLYKNHFRMLLLLMQELKTLSSVIISVFYLIVCLFESIEGL
jgi:hypothetical protein